jgi:hypothetical protein
MAVTRCLISPTPMPAMRRIATYTLTFLLMLCISQVHARTWSDATGRIKIEAELFSASGDTVVLKKRNASLVALKIEQLSSADKQFVDEWKQEQQANLANATANPQALQTWTSQDGFELRGRVIAFGQREIVIQRVAGVINVNGTAFSRLNTFYQLILPKIVAKYSDSSVTTDKDLDRWLRQNGGKPQTFNIEGVLMKLEDGSELAVPFFLFSEKDLAILNPGWEQWKAAQANEEERKREDYLLSVQADSYQQQKDAEAASHQIQTMQLELLAVNAGLISIWEVFLQPAAGSYARQTSVMVPARNSLQAGQMAMERFPGYVIGAIRRASN